MYVEKTLWNVSIIYISVKFQGTSNAKKLFDPDLDVRRGVKHFEMFDSAQSKLNITWVLIELLAKIEIKFRTGREKLPARLVF